MPPRSPIALPGCRWRWALACPSRSTPSRSWTGGRRASSVAARWSSSWRAAARRWVCGGRGPGVGCAGTVRRVEGVQWCTCSSAPVCARAVARPGPEVAAARRWVGWRCWRLGHRGKVRAAGAVLLSIPSPSMSLSTPPLSLPDPLNPSPPQSFLPSSRPNPPSRAQAEGLKEMEALAKSLREAIP